MTDDKPSVAAGIIDSLQGLSDAMKNAPPDGTIPFRAHRVRPVCVWCKKPIKTRVYFQCGSLAHPSHYRCLVTTTEARQ